MPEHPSFYRDPEVRAKIHEKAETLFAERQMSREEVERAFGIGEEKLTKEELRDFYLFAEHVSVRLVNALVSTPGNGVNTIEDAKAFLNQHDASFGMVQVHDVAHGIVAFQREKENSVVPRVFKLGTQASMTDERSIQEEIPAIMWGTFTSERPVFVMLMHPERAQRWLEDSRRKYEKIPGSETFVKRLATIIENLDHTDFENVRRGYESVVREVLKFNVMNQGRVDKIQIPDVLKATDDAMDHHLENPNPHTVELLRTVYDHYDSGDQKVLFHEFQRICKPILERLRLKKNE